MLIGGRAGRNCLQTFDSLISFRENCQDGCMLEMRKYMEWLRELCEYECNRISSEQKDFQHWKDRQVCRDFYRNLRKEGHKDFYEVQQEGDEAMQGASSFGRWE